MKLETLEGDDLFVIHDLMSAEDCQEHIDRSEALGYETFTIGGEVVHNYRDNSRVIVDDPALADALWQTAAGMLPARREGMVASGLNPRFRYYRYSGTESFKPHHDGSVRIGRSESLLTFMVYLANVGSGGETRFYARGLGVTHEIKPEAGKALVFDHGLLHEGVAVTEGTKYVLRTDVMYG
ncbi:prolyl hydroxylase family protein [Thalassoroseus pseudoceratinae]|uniref:prolyl hydroxylase family protein n=1 Tax=Thalassoroseus pseudoceratinae TaxID=2713176 RepID=UPI001423867D|nr:2OG-Fe(II) oxygenase [Thalassoroseus pseudoceratinae]